MHRGVVEDSAMTWPSRQCIMFALRWFVPMYPQSILNCKESPNLPHFVYYYGPTVLRDNVIPLILWMYIVDFVISLVVNLVFDPPTHARA